MTNNYITGNTVVKIVDSIRRAIESGQMEPGSKLPTVRSLAEQLGINRNTVSVAYRRLVDLGLAETHGRAGTCVAESFQVHEWPEPDYGPHITNLSLGNPDPKLLPPLQNAFEDALRHPPQLYGGSVVVSELGGHLLQQASADGLPPCGVLMANGAFDGLERTLTAYLKPGDRIAIEDPGFTRILQLVRTLGLTPVGLSMDCHGVLPSSLAEALKQAVRAVVITPSAQNPTGATLTEQRAAELKDILSANPDVLLIEDDHFRILTTLPFVSIAAQHPVKRWAVIRSFSKGLGPDLRMAALFSDSETLSRVSRRQSVGTQWVSHILQRTLLYSLRDGTTGELLAKAAASYKNRRETLLTALSDRSVNAVGRDGLHIWIPVEEDERIARFLLARGWAVRTGKLFSVRDSNGLRMTSAILKTVDAPRLAEDIADAFDKRRTAAFS